MLKFIAYLCAGLLVAAFAYVRLAPLDAEVLHIDPETAERPPVPGHFLLRKGGDLEPPIFDMSATALAAKLDAIIRTTPNTTLLKGGLGAGHASYVTRTALWGFPDIASVKIIDLGAGQSTVNILSRLYYGKLDFGVNEKRVRKWLDQVSRA